MPPRAIRAWCYAFRYCPDPLGIVTAEQFDKLEFGSQICTAPLPLPLGEVPRFANRGGEGFDRIRPSQSKIKDFCQLPQWGSQECLCQRQLVVKFKFSERFKLACPIAGRLERVGYFQRYTLVS